MGRRTPRRKLPRPKPCRRSQPRRRPARHPPQPSPTAHGRSRPSSPSCAKPGRLYFATPSQDQRALAVLDEVYRFLSGLLWGSNIEDALRGHSGFNLTYARILIGEAVGGVHVLADLVRLGAHPSTATWDYNLRKVDVGREYLEVVAGNMAAGESSVVSGVDTATGLFYEEMRFAVEMTPVIGSLIMFLEGATGWSVTGKKLSNAERALLGLGALLAEVGTLVRAGRTAVAATRVAEVSKVPLKEALRLCIATRVLTQAEQDLLVKLAGKVRAGAALTADEQVLANRLLGKLVESDRAVAIRASVEKATGEATKAGRFTNLSTSTSKLEKSQVAIGQVLAHDLNADVVRLPEDPALPPGVKNPDFLINQQLAELIEVSTTSQASKPVNTALDAVANKHKQAGIVVADLTNSVVTAPEFIGSAYRLWGRAKFADVTRLIITRCGHGDRRPRPPGGPRTGAVRRG